MNRKGSEKARQKSTENSAETEDRAARIGRLQREIAAGEYTIDSALVADRLIERMRRRAAPSKESEKKPSTFAPGAPASSGRTDPDDSTEHT